MEGIKKTLARMYIFSRDLTFFRPGKVHPLVHFSRNAPVYAYL